MVPKVRDVTKREIVVCIFVPMVCRKNRKIENGKSKVIKILTFMYLIREDWNLNAQFFLSIS